VPGEIHVTGNTGIDAVLAAESKLPPAVREKNRRRILVTCHRRESWDQGLKSIAAALTELAGRDIQVDFVLHPNPWVAQRMRSLLAHAPSIRLLEPCTHNQLLQHMRSADLVLSDSGGMQEEAPALGVPLLVLRDKTERPEGVAAGNAILVGTSTDRIVDVSRRLLGDPAALATMSRRSFPYGDGKAAPRIAAIIARWLDTNHGRGKRTSASKRV
jgi:UDP-N-acetylglucosamine 2-epimerase (non-hydrolysing)